jgi:hypothetical protein
MTSVHEILFNEPVRQKLVVMAKQKNDPQSHRSDGRPMPAGGGIDLPGGSDRIRFFLPISHCFVSQVGLSE